MKKEKLNLDSQIQIWMFKYLNILMIKYSNIQIQI